MATETLYATSHITGTCATPNNANGAPNAGWTTDTGNTSWTSRWAMGDPVNALTSGATQVFEVYARKEAGQSGTPTVTVNVWENGSLIVAGTARNVTSTTGAYYASNAVTTANISNRNNVEIELVVAAAVGSPSARSSVQVDGIRWTADTTALAQVSKTAPSSWNVRSSVAKTQTSAWNVEALTQVIKTQDSSWDVFTLTETIYAVSMGGHSGGLTTLETPSNAFGVANDVVTTNTDRAWFAIFNMGTPTATIMPDTATLNIRAVQSAGTPRYWAWLYEGDAEVEQIVGAQVISGTLTTYQHTINLGKIKDPSQIQIRLNSELASGAVQIDAVWIELTPPSGKVVATVDTAWNVADNAGTVAIWDFYYPDTTPEPATVGPGWNVSNWSVGAGGLNADLTLSGSDTDEVFRNYFTGGAQPNAAYSTEPVARLGSTASSAATAVSANKYIEMTFSRADSGAFTPDAITFRASRGGPSGPRGAVLRSSADGFASDIGTIGDFPTERNTWTDYNIDLSGIGEVTTLTLRFYIYTTGATTATVEMDDFVLTGTPSATAVEAMVDSSWNIDAQVGQSQASAWDVLTVVGDTQDSSWDVLTSVEQTVGSSWDVNSNAVTTGTWDGTSLAPASTDPGWNVGNLTNDGSLFGPILANDNPTPNYATQPVYRWISNNTNETDAVANDQFWSVTISRVGGGAFTPGVMSFNIAKGGSFGTRGISIRADEDAYATSYLSVDVPTVRPDFTHYDVDLSGVGEVTSLTLRVYTWTPSTGSTLEMDDLSITAVPASTSTVGNSFGSAWDVLSTVTDSQDSAWGVLAAVTDTQDSAWSVLSSVVDTQDSAWSVNEIVVDSFSTAWNVEAIGQVSNSVSSAWSIREEVEQTQDNAWDVLSSVEQSEDSAWGVLTSVTDSAVSAWDVLVTVGTSQGSAWDVLTPVGDTLDSAWDIAGYVTSTQDSAWSVAATITDSFQSAWNVEAIGQVSAGFPTAWSIDATVSDSITSAWDVLTPVGQSEDSAWSVLASVLDTFTSAWSVNEEVSDTLDSAWSVYEGVTTGVLAAWNIGGQVTTQVDSSWSVSAEITTSTASAWDVLVTIQDSIDTAWSIDGPVGRVLSTAWNIGGQVTDTLDSGWNVLESVVSTEDFAWSAYEIVGADTDAAWSILEAVESTLTSAWSLEGRLVVTLNSQWIIYTIAPTVPHAGTYSVSVGNRTRVKVYGRKEVVVHRRLEVRL